MEFSMNRRAFNQQLATLALGTSILGPSAVTEAKGASESANSTVPFDFSVMLWTVFTHLPFEERLQNVANAGYRNVELTGEWRKWTDDDYARANAKRKSLGMHFDATSGLKSGIGDPRQREQLLSEIQGILPIMEKLDCPTLILLSGNKAPGLPSYAQYQSCIDGLKAAAKLVEGKQINGKPVKLIVENIDPEENPRYYLTSGAEGLEIIKAVDHPQVRFLLDLYHEQIAEGNLIEKLEKDLPYIAVIHIADVPGRHQPGTGEINYVNIFRKLAGLKFDGMVAMEFKPLGDPVGALSAARQMALTAG
jgi:hydroxypyruvate isomerase